VTIVPEPGVTGHIAQSCGGDIRKALNAVEALFLVAKTGDIMTMPGLPKVPSAEKIDVDENGRITGLF